MASYEETLVNISLDADDSLAVDTSPPVAAADNPSAFQYRVVQVTGDHIVGLYTASTGETPVGVLQNKPQVEGMAATVAIHGVSMVEAGGTVTAGAVVQGDATGRAVAGTAVPVGLALIGGAEGDLIPVLLRLSTDAAA